MFRDYGDSCAAIMDAHLLMLDDPLLKSAALETIAEEQTSAQWAVRDVVDRLKISMLANESAVFAGAGSRYRTRRSPNHRTTR